MRRLITVVIIGIGILIAINHFWKQGTESKPQKADTTLIAKCIKWKKEKLSVFFPIPALLMPFSEK